MDFNIRIKDLAVRSCNDILSYTQPHTTGEIVKFSIQGCYTIAFWAKNEEGFDLNFVGNRPFEKDINRSDFMELAAIGQEILDWHFENDP